MVLMETKMGNTPRLRHLRVRSRLRPSFHEAHCSDFPGSLQGRPGSLIVHSQYKGQTSNYMFVAQKSTKGHMHAQISEIPKVKGKRAENKQEKRR